MTIQEAKSNESKHPHELFEMANIGAEITGIENVVISVAFSLLSRK
jgi:hypothetical protein